MPRGIQKKHHILGTTSGVLFNAEGDNGGGGAATPAGDQGAQPGAKADGDKPLGPAGERALEAERTARKELERQVQQMQQQSQQQMQAFAQAFGIKSEGAKPEDVVTQLQQQVADMQHDTLVYRVAATHGITDADVINDLRAIKDEQTMTRFASRLASAGGQGGGSTGTPKPDLTQGGQGTPPALNSDALENALKEALGI